MSDYTEQKNVRIEQRLKEYDGSRGHETIPAQKKKVCREQGKAEALGQTPGNLVHEAAHEAKGATDEYRGEVIAELKSHSKEKSCRNYKKEASEDLSKLNRIDEGSSSRIDSLHTPGHIILGVFGQEIVLIQFRVNPLLHPENLLADIVVNDVGVCQRRPVCKHIYG